MDSFEQEFKKFLSGKSIPYDDNSDSMRKMDFTLRGIFSKDFHIDVKEKRQKINLTNWSEVEEKDEPFTFIIDDLAARKSLAYAPHSGLLVRNNLSGKYYWFSILDLFLMPKKRVNRRIEKNVTAYKGKWLIDFRNAHETDNIDDMLGFIISEEKKIIKNYTEVLECYGKYYGEEIIQQGETRRPRHWDIDVNETR